MAGGRLSKRFRRFFQVLIIIYLTGGVLGYLIQDRLIFHPKSLSQQHKFLFTQPFAEVNTIVDNNRNLNIIQFVADAPSKGVVIYFHGNMQNVERYAPYAKEFTKRNHDVWMADYAGFGKSTGQATEKNMYQDALYVYSLASAKFGSDSIVIYGKSLGTGIAAYLASVRKCKRLILETPYYSMKELGQHYVFLYPASILIKYNFPTNEYLKKISAQVSILHGTKDEVIPYRHALKLKKENPSVQLFTILNGRHNNLYQQPKVSQMLDSLFSN